MTLTLTSHTVITEGIPDDGPAGDYVNRSSPFGRTGCDLLPDGSYVVSAYYDSDPTDLIKVWKISPSGSKLGEATVDTHGDNDGRMQVIALDGCLVQVLYMTQGYPDARSYIFDCSDNTPLLVTSFDDTTSTASGYSSSAHHLYLRSIGVVAICHRKGVSIYRRGRHLMSRVGLDADGDSFGIFPHPTDERKFAVWFSSFLAGVYVAAWEYTVTPSDELLVERLDPTVSDEAWWLLGCGSPYAATPLIMTMFEDDTIGVTTGTEPTIPLWSSGGPEYINNDPISCDVGRNTGLFAFAHEAWHDQERPLPAGPSFTMRCGLVSATGSAPVAEILDLPYGATSPAGYPYDTYYVSLNTGSMAMAHRNGQIVISTCIVQESSPGQSNYYAVVSWKLQIGDAGKVKLSATADGTGWRYGINNGSGRLNLQSSVGLLHEASHRTGLDAPARPAWVQTSQGWELLGRFVDPDEPLLPAPVPPATLDIVYRLRNINADLAAAITLAGPTYTAGLGEWGPFVGQASPPAEAIFTDGSDATFTTLNSPSTNRGYLPVEVFTARLVPTSPIPAGAQPLAIAATIRAQSPAGNPDQWLDGQITTNGAPVTDTATQQHVIRGQRGNYSLMLPFNLGPGYVTTSYGVFNRRFYMPEYPGLFSDAFVRGTTRDRALYVATENSALWWADRLADPTFYIVIQSALPDERSGPFQISEMYFTMRYLVPEEA